MKTLIGLWLGNACMLLIAWWGGYYMIYERDFAWMHNPVHSLIITHTVIKFVLTFGLIGKYINKPENKHMKDALL